MLKKAAAACGLALIGFANIAILSIQSPAYAQTNGPVKLCNGDVEEEIVTAAIMYYSGEKKGWVAKGWYNIDHGKCTYVLDYTGSMYVYAKTPTGRVYSGSTNTGFCGPVSEVFDVRQRTKCRKKEQFYRVIEINVPDHGGGFIFTFGDPELVD